MWLDEKEHFEGDLVLVHGAIHQEVKAEIIRAFASTLSVEEEMKSKVIYPRILIATSGSVGAGLDCNEINLVYQIGCPDSVFEFVWEMGRRGRVIDDEVAVNSNKYSIYRSLEDFIYMYEHIHTAKDREDGIFSISKLNAMQEKTYSWY